MIVAKNSVNGTLVKKIISTGTRHDESREILFKFNLSVCDMIVTYNYSSKKSAIDQKVK